MIETTAPNNRSKLTNQTSLGFDKRTKIGRRVRDLIETFSVAAHVELTEVARARVKMLAMLTCRLDALMIDMAEGRAVNDVDLAALNNSVSKIMLELRITESSR